MVVLSAAVCTSTGKPLLSRQFKEMPRDSIIAYLTSFSSQLLESDSQHTTIETELIRYLYQPVENFILLIITNLNSNIIQDMETLQLFSKTISSLLRDNTSLGLNSTFENNDILMHSFEILNSFDEIVTEGYKEDLTPSQVSKFLEMDSQNERFQEIIDKNKEYAVAQERKQIAKEIQRRELAKKAAESAFPQPGSGMGGSGPESYGLLEQSKTYSSPAYADEPEEDPTLAYAQAANYRSSAPSGRGLQLGKKKTAGTGSFSPMLGGARSHKASHLQHEHEQPEEQAHVQHSKKPSSGAAASRGSSHGFVELENQGILVTINEKINAEISREGNINTSEIKGDLQLRINDAELAHSRLILASDKSKQFQYKTHPNVDKAKFNSNVITLKDSSKSFPANDQSLGVLRWRGIGKDDDTSFMPLSFSVWTSDQGDSTSVTIEYELQEQLIANNVELKNVEISIYDLDFEVTCEENENVIFNNMDGQLSFTIANITPDEPSGSIEFTAATNVEDYLFPMNVSFGFQSQSFNFAGVKVESVLSVEGENELPFEATNLVVSESVSIV